MTTDKTDYAGKRKIIPIFFSTDDNYAPLLNVAITSIITQASKQYDYHINILCENLSTENKKILNSFNNDNFKITEIDMKRRISDHAKEMHTRDYYTKTTYFRVFIPKMFPEYKKAIYLDCDVTLNADISEFYNYDISDKLVGGVTCETCVTHPVYTAYVENFIGMKFPYYFNAGVLLLNLEKLREIKLEERFFDLMAKVKFEVIQDQDYLNVLCDGQVRLLPLAWNKTPRPGSKEILDNIKLVHYNLVYRPWRYDNVLYAELFWKHAKNTKVYDKLLEMRKKVTLTDVAYDEKWMGNLVRMAEEHSKAEESFKSKVASGKIILMK